MNLLEFFYIFIITCAACLFGGIIHVLSDLISKIIIDFKTDLW